MQGYAIEQLARARHEPLRRKLKRMTILVGIIGSDGMILAADQCMVTQAQKETDFDDRAGIRKIVNLENCKIAYAGVGDGATAAVGKKLSAMVAAEKFAFDSIAMSLEEVARVAITEEIEKLPSPYSFDYGLPRSLLIVFYGPQVSEPQMWFLRIEHGHYHATPIGGITINGAIGNAARFFGRYFHAFRPVATLKLLAAHIVLTAHYFDSLMIDGLDVAVFDSQGFCLVSEEEKQALRTKSGELDLRIRNCLFGE